MNPTQTKQPSRADRHRADQKQFNVRISLELHAAFKERCAALGLDMGVVLVHLVSAYTAGGAQ